MVDAAVLKEITIKTGVVKRLVKELCYYEKEAEKESIKLQAMKAQGDADEHLIKKQAELLQESLQMVPECSRRLAKSVEDLKKVISEHGAELQGTPQYAAANEQIKAGNECCSKITEAKAN